MCAVWYTVEMYGVLYVIATPIGNLGDVSFRAVEMLRSVHSIFCEDTRVTRKLLSHYDVRTPCISYHSFSTFRKVERAAGLLKKGEDVALVSDAGTPTVSDPGARFVREMRTILPGVQVRAIPGPSALVAALSISGAPASSFVFFGFLPRKKGREMMFQEIAAEERTSVLFEAPHRLLKTLQSLHDCLAPEKEVSVAREMTKVYEQVQTGTIDEVLQYFQEHPDEVRGEITIIISMLKRV